MHTSSSVISAILTGAVIAFAVGCSGESPSQASIPAGSSAMKMHPSEDLARSGRAPKTLMLLQLSQAAPHAEETASGTGLNDLYVSSLSPEDVAVLKGPSYRNVGTISKGLVSPDGDFVDAAGNLYVADYDGVDIQEYKPGGKSPSFTYKHGMSDPIDVSVDSHGNVYEADYDGWYVNEYTQKSNKVINSCSPGGGVEGVAVDANNDVFVTYNENASSSGKIAEYKGGLAGCNESVLNIALDFAGGAVLDAQSNLIVADQYAAAVDVIAPPYTSITRTLGKGFLGPFHITLSQNNKQAFVSDVYDVFVVDYLSGHSKKLGSGHGWQFPAGAVDSKNAVY